MFSSMRVEDCLVGLPGYCKSLRGEGKREREREGKREREGGEEGKREKEEGGEKKRERKGGE